MTRDVSPGLFGEPWCQHEANSKHVYNSKDEIVAIASTERVAARIVAAINALSKAPTEAIDEVSERLMTLLHEGAVDP